MIEELAHRSPIFSDRIRQLALHRPPVAEGEKPGRAAQNCIRPTTRPGHSWWPMVGSFTLSHASPAQAPKPAGHALPSP